ncbi:uncharacterized protein [Palaemon carinicauda]|uniref:uncharacterized protein n=1 Tax=Palaemon carinicauda TaxID=392227 RepID=UPI0035B6491A
MAVCTLADTFKEEEPIGAQLINCRMYMDDVIESMIRDLWASGVGWDDELSEEQIKMWKGYVHEMNQLIEFRRDRMIKPEDFLGDPQLHGFSDASESALGSVIWLKCNTSHGVELKFVIAKSLVSPLKQRSIPRLELTAAVVMARLALLVLQVVGRVSTMKFWTDSEIVLAWIRSPARTFKPFVSARVQEIQDALPGFSKEFCYVPSQLNPGDALTKPIKPSELQGWINGPDFLLNSSQNCDFGDPTYDFEKKRCIVKEYTPESLKRIQFLGILADESFEESFTELSSDWNRLVRITAYCRRLLLQQNPENYQSHLEPKEIQEAELALFYASQKSLNNQNEVNHKQIKKLDPKLDEKGILRIGGRLHKLHLSYEQRHPVLLVAEASSFIGEEETIRELLEEIARDSESHSDTSSSESGGDYVGTSGRRVIGMVRSRRLQRGVRSRTRSGGQQRRKEAGRGSGRVSSSRSRSSKSDVGEDGGEGDGDGCWRTKRFS